MIDAEFMFQNVGQGFFYTGKIGDFSFVYDCGTTYDKDLVLVSACIDDFYKSVYKIGINENKKKLDLLVISHFDKDHINGLGMLLEKFEVDNVVIPYLYPMQRLAVASHNFNVANEYFDILKDPVGYFSSYKVKRIVLLSGKEVKGSDYNINNNITYEDVLNLESLPDDQELLEELTELSELTNLNRETQILVKKSGHVRLGYQWGFSFFNYNRFDQIIKKIKRIFQPIKGMSIFDKNELINILSTNDRDLIKKYYEQMVNQSRETTSINSINNTSVILLHSPLNPSNVVWETSLHKEKKFLNTINESKFMHYKLKTSTKMFTSLMNFLIFKFSGSFRKIGKTQNQGTILLGDIVVGKDFDQLIDFFNEQLKKIAIVSLPHHGSRYNWSKRMLDEISPGINNKSSDVMWVNSAGIVNSFMHPHPEIVNEIKKNYDQNNIIFLSNEMYSVKTKCFCIWKKDEDLTPKK